MPPNMRSIYAKVHQTSKSVGYRRNFSSPAGDGKEPKKRSAVKSFVTQSLVAATLGAITGLYVENFLTLRRRSG